MHQAANEIHRLTDDEKRRLFDRAARTIVEMRDGIQASGKVVVAGRPLRTLSDLQALARSVDGIPDVLLAHWLYEAAEAIGRLRAIGQSN